jgi:hypothetical protein
MWILEEPGVICRPRPNVTQELGGARHYTQPVGAAGGASLPRSLKATVQFISRQSR